MARIVRRKRRRKLKPIVLSMLILFVSVFCYILSSLFLGSINAGLTMRLQTLQTEVARLKEENYILESKISALKSDKQIYIEAAKQNNMTVDYSRIHVINRTY